MRWCPHSTPVRQARTQARPPVPAQRSPHGSAVRRHHRPTRCIVAISHTHTRRPRARGSKMQEEGRTIRSAHTNGNQKPGTRTCALKWCCSTTCGGLDEAKFPAVHFQRLRVTFESFSIGPRLTRFADAQCGATAMNSSERLGGEPASATRRRPRTARSFHRFQLRVRPVLRRVTQSTVCLAPGTHADHRQSRVGKRAPGVETRWRCLGGTTPVDDEGWWHRGG